MLEYLVTSKTRRRLLKLLWRKNLSGTAVELSRLSVCAFAGVYKELNAMEKAGVAEVEWQDGHKVFCANRSHVLAKALEKMLETPVAKAEVKRGESVVKEKLAYLGLPVGGRHQPPVADERLEDLVVAGARLARGDATLARAFPVLLWRLREQLDFDRLRQESRKQGQTQNVGFLLALSGQLGKDDRLVTAARNMRDNRCHRHHDYFPVDSEFARQLAEQRTPTLAKEWGWLMNMGADAFESTFRKFHNEQASGA